MFLLHISFQAFPPSCASGYVYNRLTEQCTNERVVSMKGIHLDLLWNPLYSDTSSDEFKQMAKYKEYQIFYVIQVNEAHNTISGNIITILIQWGPLMNNEH